MNRYLILFCEHLPTKNKNPKQLHSRIKEAGAIGWYRYQDEWSVIESLMSDDAPQFRHITLEHALCWIHAGRPLKKLNPLTPLFQKEINQKLDDFWSLYRDLDKYKEKPDLYNPTKLEERFDNLVAERSEFSALNAVMDSIKNNKSKLLLVLKKPDIPLHNNPAELGARAQVRKRDVSLHTLTSDGTEAVDTLQTLVQTAKKLGENIAKYIYAKITHENVEPMYLKLMKKAGLL